MAGRNQELKFEIINQMGSSPLLQAGGTLSLTESAGTEMSRSMISVHGRRIIRRWAKVLLFLKKSWYHFLPLLTKEAEFEGRLRFKTQKLLLNLSR